MTSSSGSSQPDPTIQPEAVSAELERLILDTADEGFCLFSAGRESKVIAYNRRFADIFALDTSWLNSGPSAEDIAGIIYDRQRQVTEDRREHIARVMRRHERRGARDLELEFADGRFVTGRTQSGPGGERLYTFRDVTTERRVLDQLRLERERLAALVEHAPLAFFLVNADKRETIHVSRSIINVTGRDTSAFLGPLELWERDVEEEQRRPLRDAMESVLATGKPYDMDYRYRLPDGSMRWLRNTAGPLPATVRADAQVAGVVFDVTRRKSVDERLRSSERRFRDLVENVADYIFYEHDTQRRLTYVSPSVERMLGYVAEELIGHKFGEFHPETNEADLSLAHQSVQRAIETGERQPPYEVVLRHWSGEPVRCEISEYPVLLDGVVIGFHGVARDVTEIRAIQRRLRERERLAILGTFAGGLAHDLNNLLLPIRAGLDVLERDRDPVAVQKRVSSIRSATDHIAELTSKLLMWTRQESAEPSARSSLATDVRQWARSAMPFYTNAVSGDDAAVEIDVTLQIGNPPPFARIDGDLLKQAILNLFLNARDALPEGGSIELRIDASPRGWNRPKSKRPGSYIPDDVATEGGPEDEPGVRLSVVDSGVGMAEDVVRRAFDPFFSTKARGKSTGLGLALVGSIIRSAGGQVSIDTRPGGPTAVIVDVPAASERTAAAGRSAAPPDSAAAGAERGSVVISLLDGRAGAFVQTGLTARGVPVRSGLDERPDEADRVWIIDSQGVSPEEVCNIFDHQSGLTIVALGDPDDQPGWPEGILWLEGSISAAAFELILNAARAGSGDHDKSEA